MKKFGAPGHWQYSRAVRGVAWLKWAALPHLAGPCLYYLPAWLHFASLKFERLASLRLTVCQVAVSGGQAFL